MSVYRVICHARKYARFKITVRARLEMADNRRHVSVRLMDKIMIYNNKKISARVNYARR